MVRHEFDLSAVLEHNRELVKEGKTDPDYAEELNNWYIKVHALCQSSGKSFNEIAVWVPAPVKSFTMEDGGSAVNAPKYFVLRPDGAEMVFNGEE